MNILGMLSAGDALILISVVVAVMIFSAIRKSLKPESLMDCPCEHCGAGVHFVRRDLGHNVICPACGSETLAKSTAPRKVPKPKKSWRDYQFNGLEFASPKGTSETAGFQPHPMPTSICNRCGSVRSYLKARSGSDFLEGLFWLSVILAIMSQVIAAFGIALTIALVYTLHFRGKRRPACVDCGAEEIIPIGTPRGRQLHAQFHRATPP